MLYLRAVSATPDGRNGVLLFVIKKPKREEKAEHYEIIHVHFNETIP